MAMAAPLAHSPILHCKPLLPKIHHCHRMNLQFSTLPVVESSSFCSQTSAGNRVLLVSATTSIAESVPSVTDDALVSTIESATTSPIESAPAISDGGGLISSIESTLFLFAFVALSILTVGVIYIAITDFLDKRENEKFVKEDEAAGKKKKNKSGKKGKLVTTTRNGPKGFGQQQQQEEKDS